MIRRKFIQSLGAAGALEALLPSSRTLDTKLPLPARDERQQWVTVVKKVADPVIRALAQDKLGKEMPVEVRMPSLLATRKSFTYLEAFGRLLSGLAPWISLPADDTVEGRLRSDYADLVQKALSNAVDPSANDCMNFSEGSQPLVDASFLALGLLRGPGIWNRADKTTRKNLIEALKRTRSIKPGFNNWLLFSALIEAFFLSIGEQHDKMRIDYALRQHNQWYKGDGIYGDGPEFHWDYYNGFVIQPYMRTILSIVAPADKSYAAFGERFDRIAARYATILERLISQDGTFPVIGRSIAYRCGAFHHLANEALLQRLPIELNPAQVRCALAAVIDKTLGAKSNFDEHGWLALGLSGHQPALAEDYVSTGSLYLCATAFLPLGLPSSNQFWSSQSMPWTATNAWSGVDLKADSALKIS
jgi:hypothetical protein